MADVMGLLMESKPTNLEESDDPDAWLAGVLARCASVERSVDVLGVGYPEAQIRQQARELSGWFFHAPGTFDDSSIW
jgi:hypothetical protein